ncbi:hypothetical protein, partial [Leclercia adecarboxylata]|uniref:hypothetical protein n=1 Tax=Leclercia adecarboxylata TaxID=83655 RepID=UPI001C379E7E
RHQIGNPVPQGTGFFVVCMKKSSGPETLQLSNPQTLKPSGPQAMKPRNRPDGGFAFPGLRITLCRPAIPTAPTPLP